MVTRSSLGFPFTQVQTSTSLAWSLTASSPSKTMCVVLFLVSQRILILRLVKRDIVDTSVLLRCYYVFVLPNLRYCSLVWGSAAECHIQFLERQGYSVARLCPDQSFLSLSHRRHVAGLWMLLKPSKHWTHGPKPTEYQFLNVLTTIGLIHSVGSQLQSRFTTHTFSQREICLDQTQGNVITYLSEKQRYFLELFRIQ